MTRVIFANTAFPYFVATGTVVINEVFQTSDLSYVEDTTSGCAMCVASRHFECASIERPVSERPVFSSPSESVEYTPCACRAFMDIDAICVEQMDRDAPYFATNCDDATDYIAAMVSEAFTAPERINIDGLRIAS